MRRKTIDNLYEMDRRLKVETGWAGRQARRNLRGGGGSPLDGGGGFCGTVGEGPAGNGGGVLEDVLMKKDDQFKILQDYVNYLLHCITLL